VAVAQQGAEQQGVEVVKPLGCAWVRHFWGL